MKGCVYMQYRVDGQRIIAFDDQEPLVGEISFPKVPDIMHFDPLIFLLIKAICNWQ